MLINVKPKDGLTVRHPETGFPIFGAIKIDKSPAVRRLLKDGDLVEIKTAVGKTAAKDKQSKKGAE